jgi:hypothetical protein
MFLSAVIFILQHRLYAFKIIDKSKVLASKSFINGAEIMR